MSGHESSNSVHRARPLVISRSSFTNSGQTGALRAHDVSGKDKEDILQIPAGTVGPAAQLFEGAHPSDPAVCQQGETVAHLFGISKLMDRQKQRAATRCHAPQDTHHVATLSEVEAVERFVH